MGWGKGRDNAFYSYSSGDVEGQWGGGGGGRGGEERGLGGRGGGEAGGPSGLAVIVC